MPLPRMLRALAQAFLAALLATSSAALGADSAPVPQPKPAGPLTVAVPGMPEIPAVGPRGTLRADVYRRRRNALMGKFNSGAALVTNEMKFEGLREGMDFYYLTGIDEDGAALLLEPSAPANA